MPTSICPSTDLYPRLLSLNFQDLDQTGHAIHHGPDKWDHFFLLVKWVIRYTAQSSTMGSYFSFSVIFQGHPAYGYIASAIHF